MFHCLAKKERTNENVADVELEFWHGVLETKEVMVDPLAADNNGKIKTTTRSPTSKCPLARLHLLCSIKKKKACISIPMEMRQCQINAI